MILIQQKIIRQFVSEQGTNSKELLVEESKDFFQQNYLKSLILAQDERWRRA